MLVYNNVIVYNEGRKGRQGMSDKVKEMRKVNKTEVRKQEEYLGYWAISERVNNGKNGNPRYNVMVFIGGTYMGSYNIDSYNINEDYKRVIREVIERLGR